MKRGSTSLCYNWAIILLLSLSINEAPCGTEPRITPALLSPDILEIFIYEYPPLASLEIPSGGLLPELIQAALKTQDVKSMITILPLKRLVKYSLIQDNAVAIAGSRWDFSAQERNQLIEIPFCIIKGGYYYYRPDHKQELSITSNLNNLKGYIYGAQKGENVNLFKKAGITVKYGSLLTLYRKLKDNEIDFISAPHISNEWIVNKLYTGESKQFYLISNSNWEASISILFKKNSVEAETVAKKFKHGLLMISQDGTYIEIFEKYHGKDNFPNEFFKQLANDQKEAESQNRWSK